MRQVDCTEKVTGPTRFRDLLKPTEPVNETAIQNEHGLKLVHSLGRRVCLSPQRPHRCPDSIESASCKICPYLVNVPELCSQSQLKCLDQTHEGSKSTPKGWLLLWGVLLPSEPSRMQLLANYHILSLWQHHMGWHTAARGFVMGMKAGEDAEKWARRNIYPHVLAQCA